MKNIKARVYLLLAFSLAGTSVITGYILSKKLSSFTIAAVSLAIMLLCLGPFYGRKTIHRVRLLERSDWKMLILQAVFGIFLFRVFMLLGVSLTSTVEAGILTGTTPAITALLAVLILKEPLTGIKALSITLTVLGIALLQIANLHAVAFPAQHVWGNVLMMCAAASESAFNIIARWHRTGKNSSSSSNLPPMVQTLLVAGVALGISVVPAFMEQPYEALCQLGLREWLALVWYGLIVTALAFVFFYEGVKRCDAYTVAAFSGMIPLISLLLSLLILKESIGCAQWVGVFLIVSSILLMGKKQRPEKEGEYNACH